MSMQQPLLSEAAAGGKLRTVIVDDEPLARRGLELRLAHHPDIEVVAHCKNGFEAIAAVEKFAPDLMFLDVQMPELDGFATLRQIPSSRMPLVVFVTAFDHYAIHAFEANAVDYVLKPIEDSRLEQALFRARQQHRDAQSGENCQRLLKLLSQLSGRPALTLDDVLGNPQAVVLATVPPAATPATGRDGRLSFKDGGRIVRLEAGSIHWIEAAGDYMCIHTPTETLVVRATLRDMELRLDPQQFVRIHRSTLVNIALVRALRPHLNGEYFLDLEGGHTLKLSRSYKDKLALLGVS
jgi:two-component system LytT family response regulator